jgi:glycosyltransferase involved in cell wall biosynthesis
MPRLFIYAINVHQGGGAILLSDLLSTIPPDFEVVVYADARMFVPGNLPINVCVERIKPTIFSRLAAEFRLANIVKLEDQVLCFGNLPPLLKLCGDTVVFLQNRYLVDPEAPVWGLPIKSRIRILLESAWIRLCKHNANRYIVQTKSMQRLISTIVKQPVMCIPFAPTRVVSSMSGLISVKKFDFIYVASGQVHKNHKTLIKAWSLLANDGIFPSLALTLSPCEASGLCDYLAQEVATNHLRIYNLGQVSYEELLGFYQTSDSLIYPSYFESFGLPLVEAKQAGLAILAPELDYVRDVVDPDETFDPHSSVSIASAVKRFSKKHKPASSFVTSKYFLDSVIKR